MVDIEIKITINSVKELDPATATFIKSLAKECKSLKVESATASRPTTNTHAQRRKTPIRILKMFGLPTLPANCLKNYQINYVEDIINFTPENLLEIRHFGPQRLKELLIAIQKWEKTDHNQDVEKWVKTYENKINSL